jgi:hypothetical protein
MKYFNRVLTVIGLFLVSTAGHALEPVSGDYAPLYIFSGVHGSGSDNTGNATAIHCSILAPGTAATVIQVEFYNELGVLAGLGTALSTEQGRTRTLVTNAVNAFTGEVNFEVDPIDGGMARILVTKASAPYTTCTAEVIDAANAVPGSGYMLNGVRVGRFKHPK